MNWIERLYDIQKLGRKDLYSQNGEGLYLEYIFENIPVTQNDDFILMADIGSGDRFHLSNSRHLFNLGWVIRHFDKEEGIFLSKENINLVVIDQKFDVMSIDLDGNDYWILQELLTQHKPSIIVAEFNAAFTDSRTIKYNPDHIWDGTDYYGFSFETGKKLAKSNGYRVIFQNDNLNMYMVREDLIKVTIPEVTFQQTEFFTKSNRTDWEWI